jgi:hypothetical protein
MEAQFIPGGNMLWTSTLFLLSITALIASGFAILAALRAFAAIASLRGSLSLLEKSERLTPSKLAELADVHDAIGKGNALLKRINQREVMRDRRPESGNGDAVPSDPAALKAYLRQKAGLVAGQVPKHS